jgi:hypothetical protein
MILHVIYHDDINGWEVDDAIRYDVMAVRASEGCFG